MVSSHRPVSPWTLLGGGVVFCKEKQKQKIWPKIHYKEPNVNVCRHLDAYMCFWTSRSRFTPSCAVIITSRFPPFLSPRFGAWLYGFAYSATRALGRSGTDLEWRGLGFSMHSNSSQRCSVVLESGLGAGHLIMSTPALPKFLATVGKTHKCVWCSDTRKLLLT